VFFETLDNIDITTCEACRGGVKIIACIEDPVVIEKIRMHLECKDALGADRCSPPSRGPPHASLIG
jgi:hypothetical protein